MVAYKAQDLSGSGPFDSALHVRGVASTSRWRNDASGTGQWHRDCAPPLEQRSRHYPTSIPKQVVQGGLLRLSWFKTFFCLRCIVHDEKCYQSSSLGFFKYLKHNGGVEALISSLLYLIWPKLIGFCKYEGAWLPGYSALVCGNSFSVQFANSIWKTFFLFNFLH